MDFQSAMETFAEAWVAANTKTENGPDGLQSHALELTRGCKSSPEVCTSPVPPAPPPEVDTKEIPLAALANNASGKSLPVHCVVEGIASLEEGSGWRRRAVEADSYVIIPAATAFRELVAAALVRLGYPLDAANAAKGSVIIKNWKPLPFERISDGPLSTVGDILGELTTVATLRIQLLRPRASALQDIKDKLLRLFLAQSRGLLLSTGCPLDDITLAQICRTQTHPPGPHTGHEPSDEVRRKFEQWWNAQVAPRPLPYSPRRGPSPHNKLDHSPSLNILPEHVHPALQTVQSQYPTQKTRMRTSFDPELELPKLQRWFADNQHPSRQQIQQYVRDLNNLESRRGRKPLDVNNVVYWFKNARAAQKRAELRSVGPGNISGQYNGYNSRSHSPTNGSIGMSNEGYVTEHNSMKSPMRLSHSPTVRGYPLSVLSDDNMSNVGSDLEDDADVTLDDPVDERMVTLEAGADADMPLSLITKKEVVLALDLHRDPVKSLDILKESEIKKEPTDKESSLQVSPPKRADSSIHNNNNDEENGLADRLTDDDDDEISIHEHADAHVQSCERAHAHAHAHEYEDSIKVRRMSDDSTSTIPLSQVSDANRPSMHPHMFRSPSPSDLTPRSAVGLERLSAAAAGFPLVPNSMFSHSIMYMSHYMPGLAAAAHGGANALAGRGLRATSPPSAAAQLAVSADERRKRNRTFIDPVTEVPRLEQWFLLNTHPSHNLILKYTEELNRMPYRQKFPRLESKNVQFWFKNRRAKCKRLKMSLYEPTSPGAGSLYQHAHEHSHEHMHGHEHGHAHERAHEHAHERRLT